MTEGNATPIVVRAILVATPGTYGMIASAAPPSATQAPPKIPRATRLGIPRVEQALRKPAGGNHQDHTGPRRKCPQQADRALRKAEPLDQKRPCQVRACDNPHWAPKLAHHAAMIVGLSNNRP